MKRQDMVIYALVAVAAVGLIWWSAVRDTAGTSVDVKMPQLSDLAKRGQAVFRENCSVCHGDNGGGTDSGPPLIHIIYEPGHHPDVSFRAAAERGVRSHHWNFGDMPPVPAVNSGEVSQIIRFIREVQRANDIR